MKLLISLSLFLFSYTIYGVTSKELVAKITDKLASMESVDVSFEFKAMKKTGEVLGIEFGNFESQEDRYRITTVNTDIYCDGAKKWIYDTHNNEVTIVPNDPNGMDITDNPFNVIKSINTTFDYRKNPKSLNNGKSYLLDLKAKDKSAPYQSVELTIDAKTFLPISIKYISKGDDVYTLTVKSFKAIPPKDLKYYTLDVENIVDVIVTDLR